MRRSVRLENLNKDENKDKVKIDTRTILTILKKEEKKRTAEEEYILRTNFKLVDEFNKRKKNNDLSKEREQEVEDSVEVLKSKCLLLAKIINQSKFMVVYTGAGISTAASIPDYRGPNGVWTLMRQGKECRTSDLSLAQPTFAHMALFELYKRGYVKRIVSQNVDGLHLRSGVARASISELHGNMYLETCKTCEPIREYLRLFDVTEKTGIRRHKTGRTCPHCQGPLLDSIIHFGEKSPFTSPYLWKQATTAANKADVILCLGSSLKVLKKYSCLWGLSRPNPPKLVIVNLQWTPKDKRAVLKINGKCNEVMILVMKSLKIEVPSYDKHEDPLLHLATNLFSWELKTTTKQMITIPKNFLKKNINQLKVNFVKRSNLTSIEKNEKINEQSFDDYNEDFDCEKLKGELKKIINKFKKNSINNNVNNNNNNNIEDINNYYSELETFLAKSEINNLMDYYNLKNDEEKKVEINKLYSYKNFVMKYNKQIEYNSFYKNDNINDKRNDENKFISNNSLNNNIYQKDNRENNNKQNFYNSSEQNNKKPINERGLDSIDEIESLKYKNMENYSCLKNNTDNKFISKNNITKAINNGDSEVYEEGSNNVTLSKKRKNFSIFQVNKKFCYEFEKNQEVNIKKKFDYENYSEKKKCCSEDKINKIKNNKLFSNIFCNNEINDTINKNDINNKNISTLNDRNETVTRKRTKRKKIKNRDLSDSSFAHQYSSFLNFSHNNRTSMNGFIHIKNKHQVLCSTKENEINYDHSINSKNKVNNDKKEVSLNKVNDENLEIIKDGGKVKNERKNETFNIVLKNNKINPLNTPKFIKNKLCGREQESRRQPSRKAKIKYLIHKNAKIILNKINKQRQQHLQQKSKLLYLNKIHRNNIIFHENQNGCDKVESCHSCSTIISQLPAKTNINLIQENNQSMIEKGKTEEFEIHSLSETVSLLDEEEYEVEDEENYQGVNHSESREGGLYGNITKRSRGRPRKVVEEKKNENIFYSSSFSHESLDTSNSLRLSLDHSYVHKNFLRILSWNQNINFHQHNNHSTPGWFGKGMYTKKNKKKNKAKLNRNNFFNKNYTNNKKSNIMDIINTQNNLVFSNNNNDLNSE